MPIPALLSRDTTMTASLLFCYALSSHCPFIPPNAIQCHLSSLFSLCLSLLCVLSSVTNLAQLQQRSQRLSKLGFGRACEKDGCRGEILGFSTWEGQPVQQGVGQWCDCECLASSAASAPAARGREEEQEEDLHWWALTCNDRLHQCSSEPAGDPNLKTHTQTHKHTHTHLYPVFDQPTNASRSLSCNSFLPWQSFTEQRKAAQPPKAEAGPDGREAQASTRKGLHTKGSVCSVWSCEFWCLFSNTFFLHFPGRKPFLVGTNASSNLCFVSNLSALLLCVDRGLLLHSVLCFCSVAPWSFPKG